MREEADMAESGRGAGRTTTEGATTRAQFKPAGNGVESQNITYAYDHTAEPVFAALFGAYTPAAAHARIAVKHEYRLYGTRGADTSAAALAVNTYEGELKPLGKIGIDLEKRYRQMPLVFYLLVEVNIISDRDLGRRK